VDLEIAIRIVSAGRVGQDRAVVLPLAIGHFFVLADGASGTSGGAVAADAVVDRARSSSPTSSADCVRLLRTVDRALVDVGQTTAVLLIASGGVVFGASVGDSAAWLVDSRRALDLTERQSRKPLIGSGRAEPLPFGPVQFTGRLVLGSDGLFKYVPPDQIRKTATSLPVESMPDELVAAARLPSGGLQDDIAIIVAGQQAVAVDGRTSS